MQPFANCTLFTVASNRWSHVQAGLFLPRGKLQDDLYVPHGNLSRLVHPLREVLCQQIITLVEDIGLVIHLMAGKTLDLGKETLDQFKPSWGKVNTRLSPVHRLSESSLKGRSTGICWAVTIQHDTLAIRSHECHIITVTVYAGCAVNCCMPSCGFSTSHTSLPSSPSCPPRVYQLVSFPCYKNGRSNSMYSAVFAAERMVSYSGIHCLLLGFSFIFHD